MADATRLREAPGVTVLEHSHDQQRLEDQSSAVELLRLSEWTAERRRLSEATARRLGDEPYKNWLSISPDPEAGWWKISAKQYVGAFVIDGLHVIVRPKIKLRNLFVMLEVGLPEDAWLPESMEYAESADLLSALISFFARTAETTLARGLFHAYRRHEEDRLTLRGQLDFSRQFRRGGAPAPMACTYDDFTADVFENRCLKAAMQRAMRIADVPAEDRRRLKRMLVALEEVADTSVAAEDVELVAFTRLNEHYRPAIRLARLILANLSLQDRHGDNTASSFMLDMNELFERFVTERLRAELRDRLDVDPQAPSELDRDGRVPIRPDLVFLRDREPVGVADVKYKRLTDEAARNPDYYQLLAYATALNLPGGTLIYCVDAGTDSRGATKRPQLHRSTIEVKHTRKRLSVVGVDLSGSPADIADQISALADHLTLLAPKRVA